MCPHPLAIYYFCYFPVTTILFKSQAREQFQQLMNIDRFMAPFHLFLYKLPHPSSSRQHIFLLLH